MNSNTGRASSYRLSPVELHALRQARLRFRPSLHLLHDSLDVIPGDPVEKHGSRSWTQRATACLCLAAHNFHIPYCSAAPCSLSASKWALRLWERHTKQHNPKDSDHLLARVQRQLEEKKKKKKRRNYNMGGTGGVVVVVVVHQLFPSSRECLSSRKNI